MIENIKELLLKHNFINEGIYIPSNIENYVEKITSHAIIIPYYSESFLKGFIAYYANDPSGNAFLTMILIDKSVQGEKIGKILLECSILDLQNRGFSFYKLEVLKQNQRAILFYENYGFHIVEDRCDFWLMSLNLKSLNIKL